MVRTVKTWGPIELYPPAWLGYGGGADGIFMRVCAWHDPKEKARAEEWSAPFRISHGCCEACAKRLREEMLGERA
jgi:hypothetical protein